MNSTIHFVRHGVYTGENLSEVGKIQAASAAGILSGLGHSGESVVLSSDKPRAAQTGAIIAEVLGIRNVVESQLIGFAGECPEGVGDLDELVDLSLQFGGHTPDQSPLIVVAHMPLLSMIGHGHRYGDVPHGAVMGYEPGSWNNPLYTKDSSEATLLDMFIDRAQNSL